MNKAIWSGNSGPNHYEGWYITLIDPESGCGFWFRYTMLCSQVNGVQNASVWAFSFDPHDPSHNSQGRAEGLLTDFHELSKPWSIKIGSEATLSDKGGRGQVQTNAGLLSWDLDFGTPDQSWEHFNPKLYRIGLSSTCVNSPKLSMTLSGTIQLGEKTWHLTDAPGEQSHIWGRQPTAYYAWAHCNAFDKGEDGLFEGVNASIQKGGLTLPGAGPLLFRTKNHLFEVKGFFPMFQVRGHHEYGEWFFEAEQGQQLLRGRVWVNPEQVVAVEYDDPSGAQKVFCHNSILANMELTLYQRPRSRWEPVVIRRSTASTAFEITRKSQDERVQRSLLLKDKTAL